MCDSVDGTGREATRNRVLGAAYEVFAEVGIDAATVEAICAQAHFSRGAFYSNFASKDDLFLELIEKVTNDRMRRAAGFVRACRRRGCSRGEMLCSVICSTISMAYALTSSTWPSGRPCQKRLQPAPTRTNRR